MVESLKKGPGVCPVCKEYVSFDAKRPSALHVCSGKPVPSLPPKTPPCKWGLKRLGKSDLNQYAFPDLADIVQQLGVYVANELNPKPPPAPGTAPSAAVWPALSLRLAVGQQITQPGMVLMLGNPVDAGGHVECEVMNGLLPGVSYQTIHQQWVAAPGFAGKFVFTNLAGAAEFFQKTGAIAIMPSDAAWAGNPPATPLTHGGVMVNAHSNCAPGLMVHEIVHCYGGPAGFVGEGLTDWFAIDFMRWWGKAYAGNPAYAYQANLVERLVAVAGKQRVARLAFCDAAELAKLKVSVKAPGSTIAKTVTGGSLGNLLTTLSNDAFDARANTMRDAKLGDDVVPIPASAAHEATKNVPANITKAGDIMKTLMPL